MNKPLSHAALQATCANFGLTAFNLDRANAERAQRIVALGKARQYRQDYFSLRRAMRIIGSWEACQTNAGGWGDLYMDLSIPEAMALARQGWRDYLGELVALREV
jgi:hypothetical protein